MPRKKIDKLTAFVKDYGAKGLAYIAIQEDGTVKSSFAKFMSEDEMAALISAMNGEPGDLLLFAADKNKVVWDSLGALRVELARQLELLNKDEYRFVWITEFPQFEWSDEQNRYLAMHHPFTMPMEEDLPLLEKGELGKKKTQRSTVAEASGSIRMISRRRCLRLLDLRRSRLTVSSGSCLTRLSTESRRTQDLPTDLTVLSCSWQNRTASAM